MAKTNWKFNFLSLIILAMVQFPGCKQVTNRMGYRVVISPDGEGMAMTLGPNWRQSTLCILLTEFSQFIPVQGVEMIVGMTWRPNVFPPELLILTIAESNLTILRLEVSAGTASVIFSQALPDDIVLMNPVWNSDGTILAFTVAKSHEYVVTGIYLGISFDNGKNIIVTDINCSHERPVWTDNNTLYVQHDRDIMEVDLSDKTKPRVIKTIVSVEDVYLSCSLNDKVIYVLENKIYHGEQLLYCADEHIKGIVSDASYLAFKAGSYVYTLDTIGNVIHKKRIDPEAIRLLGISSVRKLIYLMKDRRSIQQYDFITGDEISTVFEVENNL